MKLRQEQLDALSRSQEEAFVTRMVGHLRGEFPDECEKRGLKQKELDLFVHRGIDDANCNGVIYEEDIQLLLEARMILGPRFDQDRGPGSAHHTLRRSDLSGTEKVQNIHWRLILDYEEPNQ
jgi:hypothetical protein